MLAFEVRVDDEPSVVVGVGDWAVLNAAIAAVGGEAAWKESLSSLDLTLGGLCQPDADGISRHVRWARTPLKTGSTIVIKILDTEDVTPPLKRYRSDAQVQEDPFTDDERKEWKSKEA